VDGWEVGLVAVRGGQPRGGLCSFTDGAQRPFPWDGKPDDWKTNWLECYGLMRAFDCLPSSIRHGFGPYLFTVVRIDSPKPGKPAALSPSTATPMPPQEEEQRQPQPPPANDAPAPDGL